MGINHSPATHVLEYAPWGETIIVAGILLLLLMYVLFRFRVRFRLLSATCFFVFSASLVRFGWVRPDLRIPFGLRTRWLAFAARRGEARRGGPQSFWKKKKHHHLRWVASAVLMSVSIFGEHKMLLY